MFETGILTSFPSGSMAPKRAVVFGVSVGLQAVEWNEEQKENELEVSYLERLKHEIQRSYSHNETVTNKMMLEAGENVKLVIRSFERCELAEEPETKKMV